MLLSGLIKTGITGLDDILLGGIREGNILLVEGAAGTGKTTLGLEFIYRGAIEFDQPGLIISFELSPQKLLRDAAGFGWNFEKLERDGKLRIIYTSPLVLLQELQSHDGLLLGEVARINAKRLLIDGLTPLRLFGELVNGRPFRDSLHLLVESLQRRELTAMLTREMPESTALPQIEFAHEQYICDTVLTLRNEARGRSNTRSIEISKSRGQDFISGRHTLKIEAGQGVRVYQRAQARPRQVKEQPTSTTRSSIGIPGVDEMVGQGVYDGSVTLVVGVSGTGKTLVGMHFLLEGARQGKKGLMISLDEHPAQILRNAEGLALELKEYVDSGMIQLYYELPQELELDVHYHHVTKLIDEQKIDRVVIDSLAAYHVHERNEQEFRDYIYAFTTFFKDRLITTFLNLESPELLGVSRISQELKASTIVDNIILLNYVELSNRLRRAITVPKARGSAPGRITREYTIQRGGITLIPDEHVDNTQVPQLPFSSYYGVLARSPARRSPIIDNVMAEMIAPPYDGIMEDGDLRGHSNGHNGNGNGHRHNGNGHNGDARGNGSNGRGGPQRKDPES